MPSGKYELQVETDLVGADPEERQIGYLSYVNKGFSIFVQTDKSVYKAGDTIRFRVLVLDPNTKPLPVEGNMKVYISDGEDNRIKQWNNVQKEINKGVYESELQLSSAPVLGKWSIGVDVMGKVISECLDAVKCFNL